jgi:phage shock protein A
MAEQVRVTGLRELRAELRALEGKWPSQLQKVNKAIAEDVAEGTQRDFQSMGGSGPKAASTVRALAQQTRAQVKFGGKGNSVAERVAGGNAFGSNRYRQFPSPGVYALYPTLARMKDDIEDRYIEMLGDLLARAFPD